MLGIVCAAKTHMGGAQMLFRYPPIIRDVVYRGSGSGAANGKRKMSGTSETKALEPEYLEPYSLSSKLLASILIPKRQNCNKAFEIEVDDTVFVGHPTTVQGAVCEEQAPASEERENGDGEEEGEEGREEEEEEESGEDALVAFNVAFVCTVRKETCLEEFREMAKRLSVALLHANARDYLSREVRIILKMRETWVQEQIRIAHLVRAANQEHSETTIAMARSAHAKLSQDILTVSQFAKELRAIFHSLKGHQSVNLAINGWVTFSYVMKERRGAEAVAETRFRPYHALLIVWPDEFLSDARRVAPDPRLVLPIDASHSLRSLMECAKPVKSFQDLHLELGLSYAHLYRLAAHLLYWGKAKLVYKLSHHNIYTVNPQAKINQSLYRKFGSTFGSLSLTTVLASFSQPRTIQEVAGSLPDVAAVVSWLLLHDIIKQVHEFAFLLPPAEDHTSATNAEPFAWLLAYDDGSAEYQDLVQLAPMLNGNHDLFELMYRHSMPRARLLAMFAKYPQLVVTCRYQQ